MAIDPTQEGFPWPEKFSEIPKQAFHREDIYRAELERIFYGPEWHLLAHVSEIPEPGDFKTLDLGEAPLLILRGDDGEVRVFANSCPHRGTRLETRARGNAPDITCPYHRWNFTNRGALVAAPGIERFPDDFRKSDYGMRALRSEIRHGLVFATFGADTVTLDSFLGEGDDYLHKLLGEGAELRLLGYQKVVFATNWKEYGDNEGYHAPLLHRAFTLLNWQGGKGTQCVTERGHKLIEAELGATRNGGFLDDNSLVEFRDASAPRRSIVVNLFPMTVLTRHLDVINIRYSFPRSIDEVEVHYAYFVPEDDGDEEMYRHRLHQASNLLGPSGLISLEDGAVFNRLHQGSNTPGTVTFQKGAGLELTAPCFVEQNDEASNLIRWERYREIMGFQRG
jgi:phenylpropionate dioxygenase-like ring-hydroxylating dioxygenase large terminal subunit